MSALARTFRAAVLILAVTLLHGSASAQIIIFPPPPVAIDVCGLVVADSGCAQILQTNDGARYVVDNWTDWTTGLTAQPGDYVRVMGDVPSGQCINECQPIATCVFNVTVAISCTHEIQTFCFGNGLLHGCPCGNHSAVGAQEGCANSTGVGASLVGTGAVQVGSDSLRLSVQGAPAGVPGLVFSGQSEIAVPFKDGILCTGNPTERLEVLVAGRLGLRADDLDPLHARAAGAGRRARLPVLVPRPGRRSLRNRQQPLETPCA